MSVVNASDILLSSCRKFPELPVIFDKYGVLTYSELYNKVRELKNKLSARGLAQGKHIALCLNDSREFIIALFAASACGAAVIPIGYAVNSPEFNSLISDLSIDCILHYKTDSFPGTQVLQNFKLDNLLSLTFFKPDNQEMKANFNDIAFIRPTSGTTGRAKGVVFSHTSIIERVENALQGLKIESSDRVLWVLPMAYHFIVSIILYIRAGASVVIPESKEAAELIKTANKHSATLLYAGPLEMRKLAEAAGSEKLPAMKWCICTVGGVSRNLALEFGSRHGNLLRQVYGMIEAGLPFANLYGETSPPDSVGRQMPGFEVKIVDSEGKQVPEGVSGELLIKGRGLFEGYYNPCRRREDLCPDGWFRTGDLVWHDSSGNFYISGRVKSSVIIDGKRVFSEEIENIINDHPAVNVSRVFKEGKSSASGDSSLTAEIELHKTCSVSSDELLEYLSSHVCKDMLPEKIIFSENIPLTATGKVIRK